VGIHYVWPFNFGARLAVVRAFTVAPHVPYKKKKVAEQHHQILPNNLPKLTVGILTKQNKAPKQHF
jgi:hypothetical protein